jgi:hypothetical protein
MDRVKVGAFLMAAVLMIGACSQAVEQQSNNTTLEETIVEKPMMEDKAIADSVLEAETTSETEMASETTADIDVKSELPEIEGDGETSVTSEDTMEMSREPVSDSESGEMVTASEQSMAVPDWYFVELTDVNSGMSFTLDQYRGKVILVETIAVWCSNCLRQQREIQALHNLMGERDDLISVALDIDPNESADILRAHAESNGFDWLYAIARRDVAREIGQLYGDQFLNPPSTPILVIDRHGEAHPLPFGVKRAEELREFLEPFLNEST